MQCPGISFPVYEGMEAYLRWLEDGASPAVRIKNVAFLPIIGESPFEVTVKPGTALVLPVATWIGTMDDELLDDEWFGDPDHIFGIVRLDGELLVETNEDYYVGPTWLDPPVILFGAEFVYYQALVVVIHPLPVGEHEIVLHSYFADFGDVFNNTWNITVIPNGKN